MCLDRAELGDADIATKGELLTSLGMNRKDIARILNASEETVRVSMARARKGGRAKNAKPKK